MSKAAGLVQLERHLAAQSAIDYAIGLARLTGTANDNVTDLWRR